MNRYIYFFCVGILMSLGTKAQSSFIQQQLNFPRVADAFKLKEDLLRREFAEKGLNWPADELYIRSFKYDGQLEVWVRSNHQKTFQLFKQYPVCKLSGVLGPKRREGDLQVPEGFYSIIELNPLSQFHLSLGLNYPNSADKINGDQQRPGGDIYIHGKCATVGCIPIQDDQIEELYVLVAHAENKGQQNIPVHIFPVKFNLGNSLAKLQQVMQENKSYIPLVNQLKKGFDYFEKHRTLPLINVSANGEYEILNP